MGEIHPNDIGLATYDEVGDVAKLRTTAKTIVTAINELYQNGGSSSSALGTQLYVDGEDNIIIGENNVVKGNGNLILGSNNIIVGNDFNIVSDNVYKYKDPYSSLYYEWFDAYENKIYYYYWLENEDDVFVAPFHVGDKVIVNVSKSWTDEEWMDYVSVESGFKIVEILEVDESAMSIKISDVGLPTDPPDDIHIIEDYTYTSTFIPLNNEYTVEKGESGISFGGSAAGIKSVSMGYGRANGTYSAAVGSSVADGSYSVSLCLSAAKKYGSFAANYGQSNGEEATALNYGFAYSPYSFAHGYYAKTYGRPLKATTLSTSGKYVVIASGYSLSGITAGSKIILRCFNNNNTIIFSEQNVKSVSGNTIYFADDAYMGGSGSYAYQLFPDGIIFSLDTSTSYANASQAGGYYAVASGKYTNANGYHTIAAGEGANIWGKYGMITEPYSLALANGTAIKTPGLAFKVLSDGSVHADAEYTSPCADYAEYFEWEDGNPNAEDRVGYFVKLVGEKIVKCGEFDKPLGIISAMPAIIGDSGEMHWKGKFMTDEFGRIQYHDVVIPAEYDEEFNLITEEHIERQPILNPNWDNTEEYIPRKNRPEWSPVGVLGKLVVYDDGTLQSGDICRPGANGIAVKSIENGYPVLKRISEDKVLVWFKE